MKRATALIIVIFAVVMLSTDIFAEKIVDKANDVIYLEWNENLNSYNTHSSQKPNIDIKEISYETGDGNITLKLKVYGKIENSDKVFYWIILNTTERSFYVVFSNKTRICYSMKGENVSTYIAGDIEQSDDTIIAKFESDELGSIVEFLAYSAEYEKVGVTNKWYGDWAPDKFSPVYEEEKETKEKKGLPGFEIFLFLSAVAILLWRKR